MASAAIPDSLLQWAKSDSGPDEKLNQLMKLAFGSRYITTLDHPVAEKLRGVKF